MTARIRFLSAFAATLLLPVLASSQVLVDWVAQSRGTSIAADEANNVYTLDYEQALGAEMTLSKHDVNGQLLWTASHDQTDATKWERAQWVATDSAGDALVVGTLMSGFSNPVVAASIAMKFDASGALLWRHVYTSGFDGSSTRKCLVDAADKLYVLGLGPSPNGLRTMVRAFAPDGATLWTWHDPVGIGAPVNFKFTPDGQLVIAARGITGSINGYARIDLSGNTQWTHAGVNSLTVGDVAGDSLGNSYLVHGEFVSNGGTVIKKLDPAGALVWEHVYPLAAFRIEVGRDDQPVAAGFPNPNQAGAAFIKVDPAGGLLWQNLDADGPLMLLLHAQLQLDESDDAYLAAGTLFDMAICKVRSDGSSAWTQTVPGSFAAGFALGAHDNSVFVTGGTTARFIDAADSPWLDLGDGAAGSDGIPLLAMSGSLATGAPVTLDLTRAAPTALALLFGSTSSTPTPFLGGTLHAWPAVAQIFVSTSAAGGVHAAVTFAGAPAGTQLWFQAGVVDASVPGYGASLSNGVRGMVP